MRVVKMKGGLGNQLFQYAFGLNLQNEYNDQVKYDFSAYKWRMDDLIRQPRILNFDCSIDTATETELSDICIIKHRGDILSKSYKFGILIECLLNKRYLFSRSCEYIPLDKIKKYNFFDGYWQSWRYAYAVESILRKNLENKKISISTKKIAKQMNKEESVFIGIRRGDYINDSKNRKKYGLMENEYYLNAMKYISDRIDNPVFYIFSNDICWVKKNVNFRKYNIKYREKELQINDFEEFILMSNCRHAIIANSTYYWWGAWMIENKGKIIIAPKHWFADGTSDDLVPPEWIKL
ncbi:MAG: alpha-1,2-fucosyltransferase [Selenomonas sp.]|jgi:hypothetical protein|nr:alpha-1,2-fucosyltransferase [Selenomonas sp.]